jgi:hypothetical protein
MSALDADCREYFLVEKGASQPASRAKRGGGCAPSSTNKY